VQTLAAAEKVESWRTKFNARIAQVPALDAVLALPQTFMNDSGAAVQPLAAFYKLTPADMLVVCDDFNLPFSRLRLRRGGSDGGNNGLKDITSALGTQDYPRLRFGIGRNGMDAIGFVLGAFSCRKPSSARSPVHAHFVYKGPTRLSPSSTAIMATPSHKVVRVADSECTLERTAHAGRVVCPYRTPRFADTLLQKPNTHE
jgi:peptidyl-tRNA hydrolase